MDLLGFFFDYGIAVALIISYVIVALGFMVASIFSSREMEMWSRAELREVFMSTVYAALIVMLFPVFDALINSFTPDSTYEEMFALVIDTSINKLVDLSKYASMASLLNAVSWSPTSYNTFFGLLNLNYSFYFSPQSAYSLAMVFTGMFMPILITAILSVAGQMLLLAFLEKTIFVFIGLSLFLRSFTFTRRMGSTLLGIFLGGFLFFKLALVFEAAIYSQVVSSGQFTNSMNIEAGQASNLIKGITSFFSKLNLPLYLWDFYNWLASQCPGGIWRYLCIAVALSIFVPLGMIVWIFDILYTLVNLIITMADIMWSFLNVIALGPGAIGEQIADEIANQIAGSADIFTYAFFMPFFNIIFTLSGMKALVEAFGGDETVVNMLTFI